MTSTESIPKESSIEKQKAKRGKKKYTLFAALFPRPNLLAGFPSGIL
jgi:hypothetical protein